MLTSNKGFAADVFSCFVKGVNDDVLLTLSELFEEKHYSEYEPIFSKGDESDGIVVTASGYAQSLSQCRGNRDGLRCR